MDNIFFEWYDVRAFNASEKAVNSIDRALNLLVRRILLHKFKSVKNFSLEKTIGKRELSSFLLKFHNEVMKSLDKSFDEVFALSNAKNKRLYEYFGVKSDINPERNQRAIDAFINNKRGGVSLSDRIWDLTNESKKNIENSIKENLLSGKPSKQWSKEIINNLKYEVGAPKKAADRLAITEVNMAYREADYQRWQKLDFVVGVEIKLSRNINHCKTCESLQGKYPKDFKFIGWHPRCRCRALPILDEKPVKKYPPEYTKWFKAQLKLESQNKKTSFIFRENKK